MKLLNHKKRTIRRESCWILSNICAGTLPQVQKCLFYPELIKKCISLLNYDEIDVKREVCYLFGNMCHLGNPE